MKQTLVQRFWEVCRNDNSRSWRLFELELEYIPRLRRCGKVISRLVVVASIDCQICLWGIGQFRLSPHPLWYVSWWYFIGIKFLQKFLAKKFLYMYVCMSFHCSLSNFCSFQLRCSHFHIKRFQTRSSRMNSEISTQVRLRFSYIRYY